MSARTAQLWRQSVAVSAHNNMHTSSLAAQLRQGPVLTDSHKTAWPLIVLHSFKVIYIAVQCAYFGSLGPVSPPHLSTQFAWQSTSLHSILLQGKQGSEQVLAASGLIFDWIIAVGL